MQADIDFEFVIDSSGSVGYSRWELTMQLIGENWIKEVIVPNGAKQCGNHVAGRWFSTDSERFFDFEPPEESVYASQSYAEYVGDKFINQSYISGLTNTGLALEQTRIVDLPMARDGPKYVMVFTDGVSNNFTATSIEAQKLHGVADRTYAFGIGKSYREGELEAIATDPAYVGTMKNFDDLEAYVRKFVVEQQGCKTELVRPYRGFRLKTQNVFGMSHQTASELGTEVDSQCKVSSSCPVGNESNRTPICESCSAQIGKFHVLN